MTVANVELANVALLRAWRKADFIELWLQFKPRGVPASPEVEALVTDALVAANDAFDLSDPEMSSAGAQGPYLTPIGPPAFQIVIDRPGYEPEMVKWLDTFAAALEASGLSGTISPSPRRDPPSWSVVADMARPALTTYTAHNVVDVAPPRGPGRWNVDIHSTAVITAAAAGDAFDGAETYLSSRAGALRTTPGAAAAALTKTLPRDCVQRLTHLRVDPPRVANTTFFVNGLTTRTTHDPGRGWRDRIDRAIRTMVDLAPTTTVAFAQYTNSPVGGWSGLDGRFGLPPLPGTKEVHFRENKYRHHLARYVPDARGLQVITDTHLERANDLTGWLVEPLGNGRYLVQAPDLAAWFAQPEPDPDILARARADFGPMILTPAVINAHPPPTPGG